jgi:hypothetical protein
MTGKYKSLLSRNMFNVEETPMDIYCSGLPGSGGDINIVSLIKDIDDTKRLDQMFNNLMNKAQQLKAANDIRGEIVINQLTKYQSYLTSMPPKSKCNANLLSSRANR